MREPRIYTEEPLHPGQTIRLEPASSQHLVKVLRLHVGASLRLFDGRGAEYVCQVRAADRHGVMVQIGAPTASEAPPRLDLHLLVGISKGDRMDFSIQKAVELGVTRIVPVFTARSVVRLSEERLSRRKSHWYKVIVSASEQSGRCRIPQLDSPILFGQALGKVTADLRLVLHHKGTLGLDALPPPMRAIALLIGPEGGLAPSEIRLARSNGFIPVRLGPRIMRTETAPLAALAAIQILWGDFRTPHEPHDGSR